MKVDEIRDRFLRFFEERKHTIYSSDSLVPTNDPTLLFTSAGMNQFKEEFLGKVKGSKRAATCQKCLRTGDLERVGKTPDHHTFFEMLGNFSFGDYFKKDAIIWAWEFLTKDLGLKEEDLWVSVYKDDDEAYKIWKDVIKVPSKKIMKLGAKENFWPSNAPTKGPNGPCGPCSEIFYGSKDGVEVWNLVFTQFDRLDGGKLNPLPNKNIDTGMGLERIARVMQGKDTNFEIDSFEPIIEAIHEDLAKGVFKGGPLRKERQTQINAIADHVRAVTFAIADGVLPSNEERGYVVRKLIRKAFWYGRLFGGEDKPFLYKLVPAVAKAMKKPYPEITEQREDIAAVILSEEERFKNTILAGCDRLQVMIDSCSSGILPGKEVFKLYDTYGFPVELTQEIAGSKNIKVDLKGFEDCMEKQRSISRKTSAIKTSIFAERDALKLKLPEETPFIEDEEQIKTKVLQIIVGKKVTAQLNKNEKGSVFLKETNFYGEKGGQVGDKGVLLKDGTIIAEVTDAIDIAGRVQHEVNVKDGVLKIGDAVTAKIDIERRENVRKNHTATHLLHNALRKVLGQHVKQSGSLVAPDRLRFDFTHLKALTHQEVSRVEELVNEYIKKNSPVGIKNLAFKEAKKQGVIALFGEKYGDEVRMVSVGNYSKELCGGTHVKKTKDLGLFKITSESSIASGVRRIEAVTGEEAHKNLKKTESLVDEIADELKVSPDGISKKIDDLTDRVRGIDRKMELIAQKVLQSNIDNLVKNIKKIKGTQVLLGEIENVDMKLLRRASDVIKPKLKKGIFVLISEKEERLSMVVGLTAAMDISAVKILNDIGSSFGIKGGGRPDFAQAGGSSGANLKDVLKKAEKVIGEYL